jgi:hypothetical protein
MAICGFYQVRMDFHISISRDSDGSVVDTSTNHLAASDIFLLYFAFHPEARMQM